jgi:hypothetical protein
LAFAALEEELIERRVFVRTLLRRFCDGPWHVKRQYRTG